MYFYAEFYELECRFFEFDKKKFEVGCHCYADLSCPKNLNSILGTKNYV